MDFFPYDPSSSKFDEPTRSLLALLGEKFGTVELREMSESAEWCIRITTVDQETKERLPLAALGETAFAAAGRLIRICGLTNPEQ